MMPRSYSLVCERGIFYLPVHVRAVDARTPKTAWCPRSLRPRLQSTALVWLEGGASPQGAAPGFALRRSPKPLTLNPKP